MLIREQKEELLGNRTSLCIPTGTLASQWGAALLLSFVVGGAREVRFSEGQYYLATPFDFAYMKSHYLVLFAIRGSATT